MNTLRNKTNSTRLAMAFLAGALMITPNATQAQIKGSALPVAETLTLADRVMMVTDPSGTPTTKTATLTLIKATMAAGTGDVVGPASAVNNRVVFFDGTTGKLIKDSGLTLSGTNTGDQDLTGYLTSATAATTYQPLDSDLTAIAALTTTTTGRSLLAASDAAAIRTIAGLTFGGNRYLLHSDLSGLPASSTVSQVLDWTGSTRGSILYRAGLTWAALTPGTSGQVLTSGGAGADPSWTTVGVSDGDKGSITVSSSGTVWTIDAGAVTDSMLAGSISPSKVTGTAAILGANTFTASQTITQAAANTEVLASTGYSLTGSNATSMINFSGTLNTTGVVSVQKTAITTTAAGAGSALAEWLGTSTGSSRLFAVLAPTSLTAGAVIQVGPNWYVGDYDGGGNVLWVNPANNRFAAGGIGITAGGIQVPTGAGYGFCSDSFASSSIDTRLARLAAGVLGVTDAGVGTGIISAKLRIQTEAAPSSASDTGVAGDLRWDANFIYICTATNTWKRVAIATW